MVTHEQIVAGSADGTLLTVTGVADYLAISRRTVYRLIRGGAIRPVRVGSRIRVTQDELRRYLERGNP